MLEAEIYFYNQFLYTFPDFTSATQLSTGILLAAIADNFAGIRAGGGPLFWLYSGHDTGPVLSLLAAFNVSTGYWSPYASLIALETYQLSQEQLGVRLIYNGQVLPFGWCPSLFGPNPESYLCDGDTFAEFLNAMSPSSSQCVPPNSIGATMFGAGVGGGRGVDAGIDAGAHVRDAQRQRALRHHAEATLRGLGQQEQQRDLVVEAERFLLDVIRARQA